MKIPVIRQSPTDPEFVQNPYPFYARARGLGPLVHWLDYDRICTTDFVTTNSVLRDRRFGREPISTNKPPSHTEPFFVIEAHSMLELEPPRHTRLRGLVLRAFTTRKIKSLHGEAQQLCKELIQKFPEHEFDLIPNYCTPIPVRIIARLLGVPEAMAPDLLSWSNAMVAMYQARRTRAVEEGAARAATEFADFLREYIELRRTRPADDLITHLIVAEEAGERLSTDELISTCILLLNAGHEATVHTLGNGVKSLIESDFIPGQILKDAGDTCIEEVLRHDPPLHLFTRIAYDDVEIAGHKIERGTEVSCLLASANHDPAVTEKPARFNPERKSSHLSFGAGLHFCLGAPLARLELLIGLQTLFEHCPDLRIASQPKYANLYHFHGLERLAVVK